MEYLFKFCGLILVAWLIVLLNRHFRDRRLLPSKFIKGFLGLCALLGVMILGDRIASFAWGDLKVEMQRVHTEAADVRFLAERTAELAAFTVKMVSGPSTVDWIGPTVSDLEEAKARAIEMMDRTKSSDEKRRAVQSEFDAAIEKSRRIQSEQ